jgi:ketosteroid isomerase-like protein
MAKKSEEDFFTNITEFDYKLPDIKVDVFDDMAIATFILDYSVIMEDETFNGNSRSTLVFVQDEGQWKIIHEHFSPFIQTSQ